MGYNQQSQTVFGWSQIMSLYGLSSKYGDMPLPLQCLKVFFTKLWELLHNLQHCSQALMYTIHTRYTPALAVGGISW